MNKNLELEHTEQEPKPRKTYIPLVKKFSPALSPESIQLAIEDPIDDIFEESRRQISCNVIELPYNTHYRANNDSSGLKKSISQEHEEVHRKRSKPEDALACHADNIMRMAMDSTMMSSFNQSFSSSFSNMNEDSAWKENSFHKTNGRGRPIEINAEDLKLAIELPY